MKTYVKSVQGRARPATRSADVEAEIFANALELMLPAPASAKKETAPRSDRSERRGKTACILAEVGRTAQAGHGSKAPRLERAWAEIVRAIMLDSPMESLQICKTVACRSECRIPSLVETTKSDRRYSISAYLRAERMDSH